MLAIPFLKNLRPDQVVLFLSAHCDDVPLGCGGLLIRLAEQELICEKRGIVFTGGDNSVRKGEELSAARAFGIDQTTIHSFSDTLLPNHWHDIKNILLQLRDEIGKDRIGMILCPRLDDRHQDHRVIAENTWRIFRDHLILEYELHKYEGDLGQPNLYITLTESQAQKKVELLMEHYPSRSCHKWWRRETFLSLMNLRGIEINQDYAEGLTIRKMLI